MNWRHLIELALLLAGAPAAPGRPRQAMLKRSVSAAYYALFHALCHSNADALIGTSPAHRPAWLRTYRALEHGFARQQMTRHRADLPTALQTFAATFVTLQEQRHRADYDFAAKFLRPDVTRLIVRAEDAVTTFYAADIAERRRFATLVLFRNR